MGFVNFLKNLGIIALAFIVGISIVFAGFMMAIQQEPLGYVLMIVGGLSTLYGAYRSREYKKRQRVQTIKR